jgi:hypothetical protein
VLKYFSITPPENSGGAENSTENSGPHAKNFFCSMYESNLRHLVWVPEINVKPCNSAVPTVLAHRKFMDKNNQLTLLSQCKLTFTGRNVLMALKIRRDIKKIKIKTSRYAFSGLDLFIYVINSPIQLVRQSLKVRRFCHSRKTFISCEVRFWMTICRMMGFYIWPMTE